MTNLRPTAVAGMFYPADARQLENEVRDFLAAADPEFGASNASIKALIVPHAGYRYSGPVAASAYRQLEARSGQIRRVVLLGPSHRVPLRGLGATSADAFVTPLGEIPIDRAAVEQVLALPQVRINDDAHADEHSLEVQLPFLQCVLDDFSLVPFSVGDATAKEVCQVLEELWGGDESLILISSDLSHYHAYHEARKLDQQTTRAIEELDPDGLDRESACGRVPTRGLLLAAREHELEPHTLDLRNSGDTQGGHDRVVGYGAYAFIPQSRDAEPRPAASRGYYSKQDRKILLDIARRSIETGLAEGHSLVCNVPAFPARLRESRASFVTLHRKGDLRGCIGSMEAYRPLVIDVSDRAFSAGFRDPRFEPLSAEELEDLEIEISVLSPLEDFPVNSEDDLLSQLRPGVDGLLLQDGKARGTFLPTVWEKLPEPREFVGHLKRKAGLAEDHWSSTLRFARFTTESFD